MSVIESDNWNSQNLAHRYTVSFFKSQYGDDPQTIFATPDRLNKDIGYFNIAGANSDINATICAGLLVSYMEAQGIPYHLADSASEARQLCFAMLEEHLKNGEGKVLLTADIVDHFFRFFNEG